VVGVCAEHVALLQVAALAHGSGEVAAEHQIADVADARFQREGPGFFPADLEPVVDGRVVGCRDHDAGGITVFANREVERIGRYLSDIDDVRALIPDAVDQRGGEHRARDAHVPADDHLIDVQERHQGASDPIGDLGIQFLGHDATYVVGLEEPSDRRIKGSLT
jgi:hypothetical protein